MFAIFKDLSSNKKSIYYALFFLLGLIFLQLLGRGFRGGDDPAFAMLATNGGGMWKAAVQEAIREGRFFYPVVIFISQIPYQFDDFLLLNFCIIVSNLLVFIFFFRFLKEIWGEGFALMTCFIGLALFDWVGGNWNLINSFPSCCLVGFVCLFQSFILFARRAKQGRNDFFLPALLFYFSLHFYEIYILYFLAYPLIYFSINPMPKADGFLLRLKKVFEVFRPFALLVAVYLFCYALFRFIYPSYYSGTSDLALRGFARIWQTLTTLSFAGITFEWPVLYPQFILIAVVMTALYALGVLIAIRNADPVSSDAIVIRRLLLSFLAVAPFVIVPNLLFSLSPTKHMVADMLGSYVGSYFSAFGIVIEVAILFSLGIVFIKNRFLVRIIKTLFVLITALSAVGNFSYAQKEFYFDRVEAFKWVLMDDILEQVKDILVDKDIVCTKSLMKVGSTFISYDYWSFYATQKVGKRIKVIFDDPDHQKYCTWIADYGNVPYKTHLSFQNLKTKDVYHSVSEIPKPAFTF